MLQVWTGRHKHKHKENKSICCQWKYTENNLQSRSDCSDHSIRHIGLPSCNVDQNVNALRLRMLPCAYDYRTCEHPYACTYAHACVVRV